MLSLLVNVIAPIILCIGLGFLWGRHATGFSTEFVTRLVMQIGTPCLVLSVFDRTPISLDGLLDILLAVLIIMASMTVLGITLIRWSGLSVPTYLPPLLFGNHGNMGLPLCLFAFGETGLAMGISWFLIVMVLHFSFGLALLGSGNAAERFGQLLREPVLYAAALALAAKLLGFAWPLALARTFELLGGIAIPLMLLTLGYSLSELRMASITRSLQYGLLRLLGGFCCALLAAELLELEGVVRGVVLLQAAMPMAIFNYLLALRYRREPEAVAGMVVASTVMAMLLLPVLVAFALAQAA